MKTIHQNGIHAIIMDEADYVTLKMTLVIAILRWRSLKNKKEENRVTELLEQISKGEQ